MIPVCGNTWNTFEREVVFMTRQAMGSQTLQEITLDHYRQNIVLGDGLRLHQRATLRSDIKKRKHQ